MAISKARGPIPIGESFAQGELSATVVTIISPASNVRGVLLRTANMQPSGTTASMYADTAAPANYEDTSKRALAYYVGSLWQLQEEVWLPPGIGLYVVSAGTAYGYSVTYDVQ